MKKPLLLLLLLMPLTLTVKAQDVTASDVKRFNVTQDTNVPFRLFPTANKWNFIKLDTRTGQLWAVQYTLEDSGNGTFVIDDIPLESNAKENIGRFTLYPTSNYFNFILLDQFDGRTWQVQFSLDKKSENFRVRIW